MSTYYYKDGQYNNSGVNECSQLTDQQLGRQNLLVKDYSLDQIKSQLILLTDLISINREYLTKLMVFVGDQNKQVIQLLESNIEQKIVHVIQYGMKYKCTNLIASWTFQLYQQIVSIFHKVNMSQRVNYSCKAIAFTNKV